MGMTPITNNKNQSPNFMTSLNAHPLVGDLTPEQRQALFDKLRQRKLAQARKPVDQPAMAIVSQSLPWSPAQSACPKPLANRLLEITLSNRPDLERLDHSLQQLLECHAGLNVEICTTDQHFRPTQTPIVLEVLMQDDVSSPEVLIQARNRLTALPMSARGIQATAIQTSTRLHLLLAAHPLLLDHYSLLGLAHQWLSLYSGSLALESIKPTGMNQQVQFAQWSAQVLEHKFLNQEWNRLKPRHSDPFALAVQQQVAPEQVSLELDTDFIDTHMPVGEGIKSWLLDAIHACLSQGLSHQEIFYWLETPQLRADAFESQLGFFPYYLPVTRPQTDNESDTLTTTQRLQRLQTRYSSVSEQLSIDLCSKGSSAPLIHYHWFDLDCSADYPVEISAIALQQPGLMLSPVEIHLIERIDGVTLSVHYQPRFLNADQARYLLEKIQDRLQQQVENSAPKIPTLQERLRQIWKDLLQKSEIDDEQSFFELGGHSLQVTELKFRIKQHLKLDIPISVLYELSTINKLANFILATHGSVLGFEAAEADDQEEGTL